MVTPCRRATVLVPLPGGFGMAEACDVLRRRYRLSPRAAQVALGLLEGLTDAAVAARLGISPHTLRTYLDRACQQTGAASRVHLIVLITEALVLEGRDAAPRAPVHGSGDTGTPTGALRWPHAS